MSFDEYLKNAWKDHASQASEVVANLNQGIQLINQSEQIPLMAHLITHLYADHLGKWEEGIATLNRLRNISSFTPESECEQALIRSTRIMEIASGKSQLNNDLSLSDRIRILAGAATALMEQKQTERARQLFYQAIEMVQLGQLTKDDPANRTLAMAGNNIACNLEESSQRDTENTAFMIVAALTARKHWEVAGTWLQVKRAEYRLAQTYLHARDFIKSLEHAQKCVEIALQNNAPAIELFFGHEVLALAERARGNEIGFRKAVEKMQIYFSQLNTEDQTWCEKSLKKTQELGA